MHGVPRRGYVLSSAVEEIATHARAVVADVTTSFRGDTDRACAYVPEHGKPQAERAAWRAVGAWLIRQAADPACQDASLEGAQSWYLGRPLAPEEVSFWAALDTRARSRLGTIARRPGMRELMPYILDAHGPGSRLSVQRDPSTLVSRARKKASGVFYTPPDVATFMVRSSLQGSKEGNISTVLDPAVGTGVFLRAALEALRADDAAANAFELARDRLFGCDIDELALDGAASVLLLDTLADAEKVTSCPAEAWGVLRANLRCCDALLIDPGDVTSTIDGRVPLDKLFPRVGNGFDLILGNPPYADLGERSDLSALVARFFTLAAKPKATADLYPVFLEQMTRLAGPAASGAMVVPLSLACNEGLQFPACRELMQREPGNWRFAFFDRQPHALFGEDVKTRNAIVLWHKGGSPRVSTGPLRRWRGGHRAAMLASIDYTEISADIRSGIPKVHGRLQADAWACLRAERVRCSALVKACARSTLDKLPYEAPTDVFVAPTAYNFLGIARPITLAAKPGETLSANPLHRLSCRSAKGAAAAYALLSSNLAFWWWHVTGDGFHVGQSVLLDLPTGSAASDPAMLDRLAELGDAIWALSSAQAVRSLNRGRVSYAFSATGAPELRRAVDSILVAALGLPSSFLGELEGFTQTIIEARLFEPNNKTKTRDTEHDDQDHARDEGKKQDHQRRVA